jgi:hypothetical protein
MKFPKVAAVPWMVVVLAHASNAEEGNLFGVVGLHQRLGTHQLEIAWSPPRQRNGLSRKALVQCRGEVFGLIWLETEWVDELDRWGDRVVVGVVERDRADDCGWRHPRGGQQNDNTWKVRFEQKPAASAVLVSKRVEVREFPVELCTRNRGVDKLRYCRLGIAAHARLEVEKQLRPRCELKVTNLLGDVEHDPVGVAQLPVLGGLPLVAGLLERLWNDRSQRSIGLHVDRGRMSVDDDDEVKFLVGHARVPSGLNFQNSSILNSLCIVSSMIADRKHRIQARRCRGHHSQLTMATRFPSPRVDRFDYEGASSDKGAVGIWRDHNYPATAMPSGPTTLVLDLGDRQLTAGALRELVVPLGQRLRGGVFGDVHLVIAASDPDDAEVIALFAREHELPLFVSASAEPDDVARARPVGALTPTDVETLDELGRIGGQATVAVLAGHFGLELTAANNRLVGLARKGYVYRLDRNRRNGDLFLDPRRTLGATWLDDQVPAPRDALLNSGITSDPYDTSPLQLQGDAAEHAAEILRRRGRAR